jgi:integrase/recombinase XerC
MRDKIEQFLQSLSARNASVNTVRSYRADLKEFLLFLGPECEQPTRKQIREFLVKLNARDMARSSVRRKLAAVKSLLSWMFEEGMVQENVSDSVTAPRVPKIISRWYAEEEVTAILDGATLSAFPARDRLIVELLYGTGIRVSELAGINLDDFREPDVLLVRGKGKKERLVIFGECAQDALQVYLPIRAKKLGTRETKALLFGLHGSQVERLDVRSVARIVKWMSKAKGLPQRHPHAFRHAFATHMLDHGASIVMVSKLLGHAKLSTTENYTHMSASRMLQSYNAAHPHAAHVEND